MTIIFDNFTFVEVEQRHITLAVVLLRGLEPYGVQFAHFRPIDEFVKYQVKSFGHFYCC